MTQEAPDAILATVKTIKTLSDGSVNIVFDIAPQHRRQAMQLFWESGTNAALAPLTADAAQKETIKAAAAPKERRAFTEMRRSQQAGIRCNEVEFWRFIEQKSDGLISTTEAAAEEVRRLCVVRSRSELDTYPNAAMAWDALEAEYYAWSHGAR